MSDESEAAVQEWRVMTFVLLRKKFPIILLLLCLVGVQAHAQLVGDCNGDGRVTIDDLVTLVDIDLGQAPVEDCFDQCPNQVVDVVCLVQSVNEAMR